jgi:hypothetical protein
MFGSEHQKDGYSEIIRGTTPGVRLALILMAMVRKIASSSAFSGPRKKLLIPFQWLCTSMEAVLHEEARMTLSSLT